VANAWVQTRSVLRVLGIVLAVALALWLVYALGSVLLLLVLSIFFAYLLSPVVELVRRPFARRGHEGWLPRAAAIGIVYLVLFGSIALATAVLAIGGLKTVLIIDLTTFVFAFSSLAFFIHIPAVPCKEEKKEKFLKSCLQGFGFLREHSPVLKMILFFSFINLLAYMTGFGILPAMILKRTKDSQAALSLVSSAVGLGTLAGSILVTLMKPSKNRTRVIFGACAISFLLCDMLWALGRNVPIWVFGAFLGNLPLPFLNANLSTVMRSKVPTELQGRVFSTRDTIQYCTIPLGLFLGGYLADNVFEPFMAGNSGLSQFLSRLVGTGKGSGMAVMFLLTGVVGLASSLMSLKSASLRSLDS
jgi:predicted MFS family arabinose efflux permease